MDKRLKGYACSVVGCEKPARYSLMCSMHYERKRKYGDPLRSTQRPHGCGTITATGYMLTMIDGIRELDHVRIAERAIGKKLPPGAVVHHVDENRLNNSPDNLVICHSQGYHALIHKRTRAYDACGNPTFEHCWVCKSYSDPATMKEVRRANGTGYFYHGECHRARSAEKYRQRKEARNVVSI